MHAEEARRIEPGAVRTAIQLDGPDRPLQGVGMALTGKAHLDRMLARRSQGLQLDHARAGGPQRAVKTLPIPHEDLG